MKEVIDNSKQRKYTEAFSHVKKLEASRENFELVKKYLKMRGLFFIVKESSSNQDYDVSFSALEGMKPHQKRRLIISSILMSACLHLCKKSATYRRYDIAWKTLYENNTLFSSSRRVVTCFY